MKVETAIAKILHSDKSTHLKILKLQVLALRCFASSPAQKMAISAYQKLEKKEGNRKRRDEP